MPAGKTYKDTGRLYAREFFELLTAEEQHRLVTDSMSYNPETGLLRWAVDYLYPRKRRRGELVIECSGNKSHTVSLFGRNMTVVRLIWYHQTGDWPEVIDHINGVRDDNRWCNLRAANYSQNSFNRKKKPSVYFDKGRWRTRPISKNFKTYNLGVFDTESEALAVYESKARELYGDFYERGHHK